MAAAQIPPGLEARAARWRDHVAGKKILLLLDDAAGHEQVRPLLPGTAGSLVLVTSRRRLTALEDAAVISLDTLPPGEAAALLARLAARAGICAGDAAVGEITRLCGYLPLAIGHARQPAAPPPGPDRGEPGRRAWPRPRDRLALMQAENLSVAAAFDLSYQDLSPRPAAAVPPARPDPRPQLRRLRRRRAGRHQPGHRPPPASMSCMTSTCSPSPPPAGTSCTTCSANTPAPSPPLTTRPTRDAAAGRLLDYYLHTALAAGRHFAPRASAYRRPPPGHPPAQAPDLSTLGQAAAWLEAERANLHAAADYAATRGTLPACHRDTRRDRAASWPPAVTGISPPPSTRAPWPRRARLETGSARPTRSPSWAHCSGRPGTTRPPPPAWPGRWRSTVTSVTSPARPTPSTSWASCDVLTGDYPAAAASHQQALALARGAR